MWRAPSLLPHSTSTTHTRARAQTSMERGGEVPVSIWGREWCKSIPVALKNRDRPGTQEEGLNGACTETSAVSEAGTSRPPVLIVSRFLPPTAAPPCCRGSKVTPVWPLLHLPASPRAGELDSAWPQTRRPPTPTWAPTWAPPPPDLRSLGPLARCPRTRSSHSIQASASMGPSIPSRAQCGSTITSPT